MENNIFEFSDALTLYLNGRLEGDTSSVAVANQIWKAAFEIDWPEDLSRLPKEGFPDVFTGLLQVRSRDLYDRLCLLKPHLSSTYRRNDIMLCTGSVKRKAWDDGRDTYTILEYASRSLINIAIRRGWGDKLLDIQPVVQDLYACYFALDDAVDNSIPRLRRLFPHLFEDYEADERDNLTQDFKPPTEFLIENDHYIQLTKILSLGFWIPSDWPDEYLQSDQFLWLFNNGHLNFEGLLAQVGARELFDEYC
ncbi:hypothetical protein HDV05_007224, partial [Chytridiales sp. JEL 0842]